jgi:uncharacterized membrane protein
MTKTVNTKKITLLGIMTALYVAFSLFMKIPLIGAIQLDLGYIILAIACVLFGPWAWIVGAFGCGIESILFSPYGFSYSWFIANLIIGLLCGAVCLKTKNIWARVAAAIIAAAIGVLFVKTGLECWLYQIPLAVKIPKNAVAFGVDSLAMVAGLFVAPKIKTAVAKYL